MTFNQEALLELLQDIMFDDMPIEIQEEIESFADKEGETIDALWLDIIHGNYSLPPYLYKQLAEYIGQITHLG